MDLERRVAQIENRLGSRKLVWFGTRGDDARPLLALDQFEEVISIIAPLHALAVREDHCLETLTRCRVDLDTYSLDDDGCAEAQELRMCLHKSLATPSVVAAYRPLAFFSSVYFPRFDCVEYLGLFHERQAPFEHKPWIETEMRKLGVRTIPWEYFPDGDLAGIQEAAERGPVVLRPSRSDGGAKVIPVKDPDDIPDIIPNHSDGFLAVAPLLEPHVPLNVNACIFPNGTVTFHGASLQLIGIDSCTQRPFGYCGNDFAAVKTLEKYHLKELIEMTRRAGTWLAAVGYVGAFGLDALIYKDELYLTELNPRFQGSSLLSAHCDRAAGQADLFLDHMAAFLQLDPGYQPPWLGRIQEQDDRSQIFIHNRGEPRFVESSQLNAGCYALEEVSLEPAPNIEVEEEGVLCKLQFEEAVTIDGRSLQNPVAGKVRAKLGQLLCDCNETTPSNSPPSTPEPYSRST